MTPAMFLSGTMRPAAELVHQVTGVPSSNAFLCLSLATALYETGLATRMQQPVDYASGFWQDQQATVQLLLDHPVCGPLLVKMCAHIHVAPTAAAVFSALQYNDILGFTCNRLLNWADPTPLPAIGDLNGSWTAYQRVQRPGKPSQERWNEVYPQAVACFTPATTEAIT